MIQIDVSSNLKEITASLNQFADEIKNKAVVRALNKTAMQARTDASREVRAAGYNIKASAIKSSFKIQRANAGNLAVALTATGRSIAMINYGARQTKSGVSVEVKKGRTILRHAFIISMRNGHSGVFERIGIARLKVDKPTAPGQAHAGARIKGGKHAAASHARKVVANIKRVKQAGAGRTRRANLPIRELFGPSIPSSLANEAVQSAILRKIREKFPKILEHELEFIAMKK